MNRRAFLGVLAAGLAGIVADPERLIWTPGKKAVFLPPSGGWDCGVIGVNYGPLAFHPDAFKLVMDPLVLSDAARRLAEEIDGKALARIDMLSGWGRLPSLRDVDRAFTNRVVFVAGKAG